MCAYLLYSLPSKAGVRAVEFAPESAIFHYTWSSETVPYARIESVRTEVREVRGGRRTGTKTRFIVYAKTSDREYQIFGRYHHPQERAKLERIASILEDRINLLQSS